MGTVLVFYDHSELYRNYEQGKNDHRTVPWSLGNTGSNANFDCTNPILSLSVSKDFCKRRLNIKLSGNDLFNGGINRFTLYSNRMMFRKIEDNDSRCVTLSLRYRFNVTPSK